MGLCALALAQAVLLPGVQAQGGRRDVPKALLAGTDPDADWDHVKQRAEWFRHGRLIPGKSAAELRQRAYRAKMNARAERAALRGAAGGLNKSGAPPASTGWVPLGPVPLASDATGNGFQNYGQVSGRATAVAIDPADGSGNTVYIGGAQGGVWKSSNAANGVANNVIWTAVTDDQATLSIGAIAIQPGNSNVSQSVILAGTGEADNSADSYFGLGFLRSADGGNSWTLISTANGGALSLSGLGATRMAFSTVNPATVVAAMAATAEGIVDGALTGNTYRGLYTSMDAGQTWTYNTLFAGASEATSATSVVYNASAGLFFAALRYHGFYSSPDGSNWTRLANQPGAAGVLSTTACPENYVTTCPIYRGEISAVPGRNEMYAWFIALDSNENPVDEGIWQSANGGVSWTQINESGITNCGDAAGCGVDQGFYNLALQAVADGVSDTDLYAGAVNLYKCVITPVNPTCGSSPFLNLTHVYGCNPLAAPAHVHPDQHAMASLINSSTDLLYFANDGGVYRALDGFAGLSIGSCSGSNQFDNLNQNLGSMTQFVSFSQDPENLNVMLGGTQDNGSPGSATATTSLSWGNVLGGDGGFNAIDGSTGDWFASNPDTGFGGLAIQECASGAGCNDPLFSVVVSSADVGGDDGSFYFPYILDPQSSSAMLVGTCRVWSGPRSGGAFTELSLNFDTLGLGTCAGNEVNVIRSLAAGGAANANGSQVIYATTDGLGPNNLSFPVGGNVWVTTHAAAVSGVSSTFSNVTPNGPGGGSINSNQFPISSVAIDTSDATGNTAYVTIMGFTGGPGHVWKTTNAGASWTDFSGTAANAIPDSPANAVAVDSAGQMVYVGTDVGVFQSPASSAAWSEVGPVPSASGGVTGFLPNVAVTALAIFNSGGQKLLRASTYGRGLWQFNLLATPDFQMAISNSPLTVFSGVTAVFNGTLTAVNGYNNNVGLSCLAGATNPPVPCVAIPATATPTAPPVAPAAFAASSTGTTAVADYSFNVQGIGFDPQSTTHVAAVTLHVVNWSATTPSPPSVNAPRGATSPPVSFQISSQGTFSQTVNLSCIFAPAIAGATCGFTPGASFTLATGSPVNVTVTVTVPAGTTTGPYGVTVQAATLPAAATLNANFTANVTLNPTFVLTESAAFPNVKAGTTGTTGSIGIAAQDGFNSAVTLGCVSAFGPASCSIAPSTVSAFPATATLTINGSSFSAGNYQVAVQGISGALTNWLTVPFNVGDFSISGPATLATIPGGSVTANLTFTGLDSYSAQVDIACDASALAGAQCGLSPAGPITVGGGAVGVAANLAIPNTAAVGNYNVNITAHDAGGEPGHTFTTAVWVQDFAFSAVTPPSQSIGAGGKAIYTLNVAPVGASFPNPVILSCSTTAPNSTCTVNPASVTPNINPAAVTIIIAGGASTPQGNYSVVVTGVSNTLSHSVTVPLAVANTLSLAVTQAFPANLLPTATATAVITLTSNYSGSVNLAQIGSTLSGVILAFNPVSPIAVSGSPIPITVTMTIPSAAPGNYSVTIAATDAGPGGMPTQAVTLPFAVVQDFTISIAPQTSQTITAGQSVTYNVTVAPVGTAYSGTVTLTCAAFPTLQGSCAIVPASVGPLSDSTSAAAVMTVATTPASSQLIGPAGRRQQAFVFLALLLFLPGILILSGRRRNRLRLGCAIAVFLSTVSCSGGGGTNNIITKQVTPVTYTITVTGTDTSSGLTNTSPSVTLIVN